MTNPYFDASVQLPAGFNELPGYDPYWQTEPLRAPIAPSGNDDPDEILSTWVGAGESLQFEAIIFIGGDPAGVTSISVNTPPNPNGGFQYLGPDESGSWQSASYGADAFNTDFSQHIGTGLFGTLEGYSTHYINGILANGDTPGTLHVSVQSGYSGAAKPGSILRVHRIFDARKNEVGA